MIESLNNFYNGNWPFNCTIIDEVCSQPIQNWKNFIANKITPNKSVRNLESIIEYIENNSNNSSKILEVIPKVKEFISKYYYSYMNASNSMNTAEKYERTAIRDYEINDITKWVLQFNSKIEKIISYMKL